MRFPELLSQETVSTLTYALCIHIVCAVAIKAPDPSLPETGISNGIDCNVTMFTKLFTELSSMD